MKVLFGQPHAPPTGDDAFDLLTTRYRAAHAEYQHVVDRNTQSNLTGGKPSEQARLDEERAFEELDVARDALMSAAALAYPTFH